MFADHVWVILNVAEEPALTVAGKVGVDTVAFATFVDVVPI